MKWFRSLEVTAGDDGSGVAAVGVLRSSAFWSRCIVAVTIVAGLVLTALPAAVAQTPVLVLAGAGLLAGLPHGSVDHRIAAALTGWPTALVATAYAATAALVWLLLTVAGPLVLAAVLALSVAHFGLGELAVLRETTGWRPTRVATAAFMIAGTGALLLPLARSGAQVQRVTASISPPLAVLFADTTARAGLVGIWGLAAAVAVAAALRARQPTVVLDVLLIGTLGAVVPPLVAFAVWFGGWHSLRHSARLLGADPSCASMLERGHPRRAVATLVRLAAWPTLAAATMLAVLLVSTATAADPARAIGQTLILLLALTVPHMIVVLCLDHPPRWSRPAGPRGAPVSR